MEMAVASLPRSHVVPWDLKSSHVPSWVDLGVGLLPSDKWQEHELGG